MPAKSPTDLTTELGILAERNDNTRRDVGALKTEVDALATLLDDFRKDLAGARTDAIGELHRHHTEMHATAAELRQDIALVRQKFDDHLKRMEIWSGRLWTLVTVLIGAVLTLASGLIVILVKK